MGYTITYPNAGRGRYHQPREHPMSDPHDTATFRVKPPPLAPDPQGEIDAAVAMAQAAMDAAAEAIVRCARGDQMRLRLGLRQLRTMAQGEVDDLHASITRAAAETRYETTEG